MPEIKMTEIESSSVHSVGYDQEAKQLHVTFRGRDGAELPARYVYDDVPREIYDGLIASDSKGVYFREKVKTGKFKFKRVV